VTTIALMFCTSFTYCADEISDAVARQPKMSGGACPYSTSLCGHLLTVMLSCNRM
jgi:hypothetical protein